MKLIIENWNNFLQEQISWEPTNSDNIAQHIKLGKQHIIKYTHYLGKKALQSGKDEDVRLLTLYWNTFSDEHPEIRDIWASYYGKFKQQDLKNHKQKYEKELKASAEKLKSSNKKGELVQKAVNQSIFLIKVLSEKEHENMMQALKLVNSDPAKAKEFEKRYNNFRNISKKLNQAVQQQNFDFIDELYKNFGGK